MEISSESQTPKMLPFPGTDYIGHETVESDDQGETSYIVLASNLVHEWLNQALDDYELMSGGSVCQPNTSVLDCETSNISSVESQACSIPEDAVEYSPTVKQLSYEALGTSDSHVKNLTAGQCCAEEKQTRGKCRNGIEMNGKSLSCSLLVTNVLHRLQHQSNLCADSAESDANMHLCEPEPSSHSKGSIRHTKSETFLQHIMKEISYLKSDHTGDHSACYLVSSVSKDGDLTNVRNLLPVNTSKAEHYVEKSSCKDLQNVDTNDETLNQIRATVGHCEVSQNGMEDIHVPNAFSAAVDANCMLAHKQAMVNGDIGSQDACKVVNSSSDTVLSEDCNSTNNGSEIFLSGPGVQVSFLALSVYLIS